MNTSSRTVLVVGPEPPALRRLVPLLARADLDVEIVPTIEAALGIVAELAVMLVIVRYPPSDKPVSALLEVLRASTSPNRRAGLLLLSEPQAAGEAEAFLGFGVNRVVTLNAPGGRLLSAVADLIGAAPRTAARVLVQLRIGMGEDREISLHQTRDISLTGAFIPCKANPPLGVRLSFELALPGDGVPVRGTAEVVRHAGTKRENTAGFGVQFLSLSGDGRERLERWLLTGGPLVPGSLDDILP